MVGISWKERVKNIGGGLCIVLEEVPQYCTDVLGHTVFAASHCQPVHLEEKTTFRNVSAVVLTLSKIKY